MCISACTTLTSMFDEFNHYIFNNDDIYDRAYRYVQRDIYVALDRMTDEE